MPVDTSLPTAYITGNTMAVLPAIESTAYTTTYTEAPGSEDSGITPYYRMVQWGRIAGDIRNQKDLIAVLEEIQNEAADEVIKKVGTIFVYKGQVPTIQDLPTDPTKGDTWNVDETGANYVWNGEVWDKLSETIDLSDYVDKDTLEETMTLYYNKLELDELINALTITLQTQINTKADITDLEQEIADREEAVQSLITSINNVITDINNNYCTKTYLTQQLDEVQDDLDAEIEAREQTEQNIQTLINTVKEELKQEIQATAEESVTLEEFDEAVEELQTNIDKVADDLKKHIEDAETGYVTNADLDKLESKVDAADAEIEDRLDAIEAKDYVEYIDISTEENPNRKAIVLDNHDGIFGKDTEGNTRTLGMISKYNVADFGTPHLHTNLNTQQIVTINDVQAVLTDKNLDQIVLPGDNVTIGKQTVTEPNTGFQFQTLTINANLEDTTQEIEDLKTALAAETQKRQDADSKINEKIATNKQKAEDDLDKVKDDLLDKIYEVRDNAADAEDLSDLEQAFEDYKEEHAEEVQEKYSDLYTEIKQTQADLRQTNEDWAAADRQVTADLRKYVVDYTSKAVKYKGQKQTVDNLPNGQGLGGIRAIGDMYNVVETGANYVWNGEEWDKLSETIDLSDYDKIEDRQAADAKIISKIWNQADLDKGYFQTKATTNKGTAMIWNESDGGGSKYEGKDGLWSYTGVNEGTANKVSDEEGNILTGRANEVMGQIYVYDSTNSISEKGNKGSWIDMTLDGFYYKKGANSNVTLDNELAVIGDVKTVQNGLDTLQENVDNSLANQDGNIQALLLQMATLESKIEGLKSLDYEIVELYDGSDPYYANEQKSFMLSGSVTTGTKVVGENITLDEATVYSSPVEFTSIQDITVKESTLQGTVYKAVSNAMLKLHADDYISVRDCQIIPETAYNGIEIGLTTGLAKSVIIDNVNFDGTFSNNAINIFGMDEGGVVTISNCYFKKVSNLLRLSNRTNTHWTVNLINCVCDEWETGEYAGMILLQDYTSGSADVANTNNIFNKLTINIQNCTKPDGTKIQPVEDLSTICGCKNNDQIIYMWDSWRLHTPYSDDKYPTINIL